MRRRYTILYARLWRRPEGRTIPTGERWRYTGLQRVLACCCVSAVLVASEVCHGTHEGLRASLALPPTRRPAKIAPAPPAACGDSHPPVTTLLSAARRSSAGPCSGPLPTVDTSSRLRAHCPGRSTGFAWNASASMLGPLQLLCRWVVPNLVHRRRCPPDVAAEHCPEPHPPHARRSMCSGAAEYKSCRPALCRRSMPTRHTRRTFLLC